MTPKKTIKYDNDFIIKAHEYCNDNKTEILNSKLCGCFYCEQTFKPSEIKIWSREFNSETYTTAICPNCKIDSVLSDKFPIEKKEFLKSMNNYWF